MSTEGLPPVRKESVAPEIKVFEGVSIQWNKVPWNFTHPKKGPVSIDTYSIWNPEHHDDIARRLALGQTCALYMMGNFGVAEVRNAPDWQPDGTDHDKILDDIKQRDRIQNLLAFADPENIRDFIDIDRLPPSFKNLRWPGARLALYPGPMHAILPIKDTGIIDQGLVKQQDKTTAFFWIPGHWGYEKLAEQLRKKVKHGVMGGGSLNIHQQEPCYTTSQLRDREMVNHPEWQELVDFVILDEIAEAAQIGRSHTQISFIEDPPRMVRIGSLSPQKISKYFGKEVVYDDADLRHASSLTPYDDLNNMVTDVKVDLVLNRIERYEDWYKMEASR